MFLLKHHPQLHSCMWDPSPPFSPLHDSQQLSALDWVLMVEVGVGRVRALVQKGAVSGMVLGQLQ